MNKSRPSTHLLILLIIAALAALGHYTIHYSALIRGYETSWATAGRNLFLFLPLLASVIILARTVRFAGNWTLFTTAVLLFSIGLVGQYRLFSDPEYVSIGDKAQAREQKIETQQLRYIKEHYSAEKKRLMGLPATPPAPVNLADETPRPAPEGIGDVLFSGKTLIPLFAFACFLGAFLLFRKDRVLDFFQNNGFLLVLLTLVPLMIAAFTSSGGKSIGNMTPWEMSKVPFLLGFAAILTVLYRNLTKTTWGVPSGRDVVPLIFMAAIPFVPFLVLKDFGQMLVFASAYIVLYLVAVKRLPQRIVFVGSVAFLIAILTLAVLPTTMQTRVPLLSTIAEPLKKALPGRIHQRFYLWFEALKPPPSDTFWWRDDFENFYAEEYRNEIIEKNPDLQEKAVPVERQIAPLVQQLNQLPRGDSRRADLQKKINDLQRPINAEVKERAKQELAELRQTAYPQLAETEKVGDEPSNIENNQPPNPEAQDDYSDPATASLEEQQAARSRLDSLNEEAWFADDAMQSSRATFGISSGGKTGRGLGLGFPELIPVADSDYIYAALGEETGLVGGLLIILTLIVFVNAGIRTALDARDMFTKLCAAGLTAFIGFQGLVNIGGITRALPMTGITLPFVSHGGFSLITSFVMLGMLLAISHRNGVDAQFNGTKPPENE